MYFDKAIEHNQNFAEAYYKRGLVYLDLKQYDKAIEDFNQAIKLGSSHAAEAYYNRGVAYLHRERYDKAIHAETYYNCGVEHFNKEQYNEAIGCFRQTIEYGFHCKEANFYIARAYQFLGRPDLAKKYWEKVV